MNVTIDYTYDPLNRLTAADYPNGKYFHCTYDAVGDRLSQESQVNGLPASLEYTYDIANRLTAVGSVAYTWDSNGNLMNDGVNDYTYDYANRLTVVSGGQTAASYAYDGLGNRLQQTVNSNTITYVNDLNAGLTQVLSDGTNTYTYGLERISQVGSTETEYFLGDALGSVRQLTDLTGALTLTKDYDPFGVEVRSWGIASTIYGFTAEQTDSYIKLINLRSRMYSPATGTFLTRDSVARR